MRTFIAIQSQKQTRGLFSARVYSVKNNLRKYLLTCSVTGRANGAFEIFTALKHAEILPKKFKDFEYDETFKHIEHYHSAPDEIYIDYIEASIF